MEKQWAKKTNELLSLQGIVGSACGSKDDVNVRDSTARRTLVSLDLCFAGMCSICLLIIIFLIMFGQMIQYSYAFDRNITWSEWWRKQLVATT